MLYFITARFAPASVTVTCSDGLYGAASDSCSYYNSYRGTAIAVTTVVTTVTEDGTDTVLKLTITVTTTIVKRAGEAEPAAKPSGIT